MINFSLILKENPGTKKLKIYEPIYLYTYSYVFVWTNRILLFRQNTYIKKGIIGSVLVQQDNVDWGWGATFSFFWIVLKLMYIVKSIYSLPFYRLQWTLNKLIMLLD